MIKYGVEYVTEEQDKIVMYSDKETAKAEAERIASQKKSSECVSLFYAECDETGKLATNEFNMIQVWD